MPLDKDAESKKTGPQEHSCSGREFFHKISTPAHVIQNYLETSESRDGFSIRPQYLTTQDKLLLTEGSIEYDVSDTPQHDALDSLPSQAMIAPDLDDKMTDYKGKIYSRLRALKILNESNVFQLDAYHAFVQCCIDRGLVTAENLAHVSFNGRLEEYIIANHYRYSFSTHYSGLNPHRVDYTILIESPDALSDAFKQTRFYQTMKPVQYTDAYRKKYFTVEYAQTAAEGVQAPENRAVLWSGGYIPNHPNFYGLGRISAEAGAVYLNSMIHKIDVDTEFNDFCTVAMTDVALPVLNPMWSDPEIPMTTKYEVTPHYIVAFVKHAKGAILSLNVDDTDTDSFFRKNELPIVLANKNITHVRVMRIEAATQLPIFIHFSKQEWLEFQKDQWVKSIIVRTELVMQETEQQDQPVDERQTHLNANIKRMKQAFIEECKDVLSDRTGSSMRQDARLANIASYVRKRPGFFDSAFDATSVKKIRLSTFRYYAKLTKELNTQRAHIQFKHDHLIELIDPLKRPRNIHEIYFSRWELSLTTLNYFDWLDIVCPESKYPSLASYLTPCELHRYVVHIESNGDLVQRGQLIDTRHILSNYKEFALFFWVLAPELSPEPVLIITDDLKLDHRAKIIASGLIRVIQGKVTHISHENDYISTHSIETMLGYFPEPSMDMAIHITEIDAKIRFNPQAYDRNLTHPSDFRRDIATLQRIEQKTQIPLMVLIRHCLTPNKILLDAVVSCLCSSTDPAAHTDDLIQDVYQTVKDQVHPSELIELGNTINHHINRFVEIYKTIGPQYATEFDYFKPFSELMKTLDIHSNVDLNLAKTVLFDEFYTLALIQFINDKIGAHVHPSPSIQP